VTNRDYPVLGYILVLSAPTTGRAPPEIREKWVGCMMPYILYFPPELAFFGSVGYSVLWDDAMEELGKKSSEAREWWETNRGSAYTLTFHPDCCEAVQVSMN
jgi:hypothetical protein